MPAKTKAERQRAKDHTEGVEVLWKGPDWLRPFLVPMSLLHEDIANANEHNDRSISEIAASYARFGQQQVVLTDESGVVRAGNGQLRAAGERLGWTHIAAAVSDLQGTELTLFSLAHNRTAHHADLDERRVSTILIAAQEEQVPLDGLGYSGEEIESLLATQPEPPPPDDSAAGSGERDASLNIHLGPHQAEEAREAFRAVRDAIDDEIDDAQCVIELCRKYMNF